MDTDSREKGIHFIGSRELDVKRVARDRSCSVVMNLACSFTTSAYMFYFIIGNSWPSELGRWPLGGRELNSSTPLQIVNWSAHDQIRLFKYVIRNLIHVM